MCDDDRSNQTNRGYAIGKDGKVVGRGSDVGILDQGGKMDDG
ncbi:MAG: hypothetical protein AEth_01076 [Candidatus Argoarchaeum ethanivorans]|uniref:Uncharacterized protein n=1 Tax=Candidatus Argoarchaeum ethanivorans TaxID=2608793 RepID=A0A8B3S261_9EURY|nr:MAG: hypothetical protein AEth_01076 [Candidatus Argoarchaeum ethanivorans]